jgi:hypothetical protein
MPGINFMKFKKAVTFYSDNRGKNVTGNRIMLHLVIQSMNH